MEDKRKGDESKAISFIRTEKGKYGHPFLCLDLKNNWQLTILLCDVQQERKITVCMRDRGRLIFLILYGGFLVLRGVCKTRYQSPSVYHVIMTDEQRENFQNI